MSKGTKSGNGKKMNLYYVDYVWLGGEKELRSKLRIIRTTTKEEKFGLADIPEWNYDGSSTGQANGESSEVFIQPKNLYRCPFRKDFAPNNSYIVICDTYDSSRQPLDGNSRFYAEKIFKKYENQHSWYGLEQEYFIYDRETNRPVGFDPNIEQGQFYCSVGAENAFCRHISDEHVVACIYAGIHVSGTNAEVAPGQWEYQIGPVEGIDAADQLWVSRYIFKKIGEKYNKRIVFDPKPVEGNYNGSGCHINFSTEAMRDKNGIIAITDAIDKLKKSHKQHMEVYGEGNEKRMTGLHETANFNEFTHGVANRKCSIRIPYDVSINGGGYFEDRRPAANVDPWEATAKILETVMS